MTGGGDIIFWSGFAFTAVALVRKSLRKPVQYCRDEGRNEWGIPPLNAPAVHLDADTLSLDALTPWGAISSSPASSVRGAGGFVFTSEGAHDVQ